MNQEHYEKALEYSKNMTAWLRGEGEKPVALNLVGTSLTDGDNAPDVLWEVSK